MKTRTSPAPRTSTEGPSPERLALALAIILRAGERTRAERVERETREAIEQDCAAA